MPVIARPIYGRPMSAGEFARLRMEQEQQAKERKERALAAHQEELRRAALSHTKSKGPAPRINPFREEFWSVDLQMLLIRDDPEEARRLAALAGQTI